MTETEARLKLLAALEHERWRRHFYDTLEFRSMGNGLFEPSRNRIRRAVHDLLAVTKVKDEVVLDIQAMFNEGGPCSRKPNYSLVYIDQIVDRFRDGPAEEVHDS